MRRALLLTLISGVLLSALAACNQQASAPDPAKNPPAKTVGRDGRDHDTTQ